MMKKGLTLKDIVERTNVSKATISFVLNGKSEIMRIIDSKRDEVLLGVKEIGYELHLQAKGLRTGKTNFIGLIVEDISNPFYSRLALRFQEIAFQKGLGIVLFNTRNDVSKTREIISILCKMHSDGCIAYIPVAIPKDEITHFCKEKFPVVQVENTCSSGCSTETYADGLFKNK